MRDISDKPFRFVRPAYQPAISPLPSIFFFFFIQSIQPSPHSVLFYRQAQKSIWRRPFHPRQVTAISPRGVRGLVASQEHFRTEGSHERSRDTRRCPTPGRTRRDTTLPEVEAVNFKVCHENITISQRWSVIRTFAIVKKLAYGKYWSLRGPQTHRFSTFIIVNARTVDHEKQYIPLRTWEFSKFGPLNWNDRFLSSGSHRFPLSLVWSRHQIWASVQRSFWSNNFTRT